MGTTSVTDQRHQREEHKECLQMIRMKTAADSYADEGEPHEGYRRRLGHPHWELPRLRLCLGAEVWEEDDLTDRVDSRKQHGQTVDADSESATGR